MLQNPTLTKNTYYLQLTKNVMSDTISVIKNYVIRSFFGRFGLDPVVGFVTLFSV